VHNRLWTRSKLSAPKAEDGSDTHVICPLCPFSIEKPKSGEHNVRSYDIGSMHDGWKVMRDHIAAHLESIALLSLPEQEEIENAASDDVQSQSARDSSRHEDQDLLMPFSIEDSWNSLDSLSKMQQMMEMTTKVVFAEGRTFDLLSACSPSLKMKIGETYS
jgi:hypothetical protein